MSGARKRLEALVQPTGRGSGEDQPKRLGRPRIERLADERKDAPINVYLVHDKTGSMKNCINQMQLDISNIAKRLFQEEDNIRAAVWAVADHTDGPGYLEMNTLTNDYGELKRQIDAVIPMHGDDSPEAYECAFHKLYEVIQKLKGQDHNARFAVYLIGDAIPHGMTDFTGEDNGCPDGIDYVDAMKNLKSYCDRFTFVACPIIDLDPETPISPEFKEHILRLQETLIDPRNANESFIELEKVDDWPNLAIASIKQLRSQAAYKAFINMLEPPQSQRISLMLGGGPTG